MPKTSDYVVQQRYLVAGEGWKVERETLIGFTLEEAWATASQAAKALDDTYGGDHFWTVDLKAPDGCSYVQLFHGRLS